MSKESMTGEKPSTPCVQRCEIETKTGFCLGCHRTRAEIANWGALTEAERRAIMRELAERRPRLSDRS
jgi:hypothetical protein